MLQKGGERRCEVVRGAVDTTEEERIDANKAAVGMGAAIGIGALPAVIGAAVAVKRSQDLHDVAQCLQRQKNLEHKVLTGNLHLRCSLIACS